MIMAGASLEPARRESGANNGERCGGGGESEAGCRRGGDGRRRRAAAAERGGGEGAAGVPGGEGTRRRVKGGGEGVELVAEDWRLSQFWYNERTARDLSEEVAHLASGLPAGGSAAVAYVACPTLYAYLRKSSPDVLARLLEYDERFGQYGDDFAFSRGLLSPRALPALSIRGAVIHAGDEDSLYYAGLRRCTDDPYHPASNPAGVIQLGLAENHLSLDLVREWMEEHAGPAMTPGGGDKERDLTISGLATYQPYDGILALKMSQECWEKVAKTVSFLTQPEGSFLLLLTGEVQKDRALELLNVRPFYFVYLCGVKT
ncbi:hypothetical protein ZWY2020_032217 [Hordeum vulgare]|nr:hypothetical protein ZWY2020_032217 [Hordeum vulgare]